MKLCKIGLHEWEPTVIEYRFDRTYWMYECKHCGKVKTVVTFP